MIFKRTKTIEGNIEYFLDTVTKSALILNVGIDSYLKNKTEDFEKKINKVREYENRADDLRKSIEIDMYTYALMPESRGDVLGLIENIDKIIDLIKEVLIRFSIESPNIAKEYHESVIDLTQKSVKSVEELMKALRHFFNGSVTAKDYINKVSFLESEVDIIAKDLKKRIFQSNIKLSEKMHFRYFITSLEEISDMAEDVSERLTISIIKRSI